MADPYPARYRPRQEGTLMNRLSPPKYVVHVIRAANAAAYTRVFTKVEFRTEIHHVTIADVAGHALEVTNFMTFKVSRVAAVGGAVTDIATRTTNNTGGTALAANVPQSLTIITASNAHVVPAGDYLSVTVTPATGTAAAVDMTFVIAHTQYTSNNPNN
jgi:hypothetical protein